MCCVVLLFCCVWMENLIKYFFFQNLYFFFVILLRMKWMVYLIANVIKIQSYGKISRHRGKRRRRKISFFCSISYFSAVPHTMLCVVCDLSCQTNCETENTFPVHFSLSIFSFCSLLQRFCVTISMMIFFHLLIIIFFGCI